MNWDISKISIPVFDLKKSKEFYDFILNDLNGNAHINENEDECLIGSGDCKLRLYSLKHDLAPLSRRTFPTILVKNFEQKIDVFSKNKVNFKILDRKPTTIIIQETSFNYIELMDIKDFKKTNFHQDVMNWGFHHINLESYDVRESVNFFKNFLNLDEGTWQAPKSLGDVNIKKDQLAVFPLNKKHGGLHINKADFTFSWRNKFIHNPTIGGHPAFSVKNIKEIIAKLKKNNIPFTDAKVYAMPGIYQVYLYDPNANVIEINQSIG